MGAEDGEIVETVVSTGGGGGRVRVVICVLLRWFNNLLEFQLRKA